MIVSSAFVAPAGAQQIWLVDAAFDPADGVPSKLTGAVFDAWRGDAVVGLKIVQFHGVSRREWRQSIVSLGGEVIIYVPDQAHVVRADARAFAKIGELPFVRWMGALEPGLRVPEDLRAELLARRRDRGQREFLAVLADKRTARAPLAELIKATGARFAEPEHQGAVVRLVLDQDQLLAVIRSDFVLWMELAGEPALDARTTAVSFATQRPAASRSVGPMDNARSQTGADILESLAGYTGQGMRGHIYEGVEATHPDFTTTAMPICAAAPSDHGHAVAGIVFGNGTSLSLARGMVPDAECLYTDRLACGQSRHALYGQVVAQEAMFTVASFGSIFTSVDYRVESAAVDDAVFDHDIPAMQSQGNIGFQLSRQEAWAKNGISVGGVAHGDNADPADDSWFVGGASTGPSLEGRVKPDLAGFVDNVLTSDRTGADGFTSVDVNPVFGGTSAATPMVGGSVALALQMFTDGVFGNTLRVPGGTRFQNRPHFTTAKALAIESARQYAFDASSFDNRREHQGWGMPDVASLWERRNRMLVVDEAVPLELGDQVSYVVDVVAGEAQLSMTMTYADPMAMPLVTVAQINDLDLTAIAPDGTLYHGNFGLMDQNTSLPGGVRDDVDTVERVIVPNPLAGRWTITVRAVEVNQDARVETPAIDDVDFALVVSGATQVPCVPATIARSGVACGTSRLEFVGAFCLDSLARLDVVTDLGPGLPTMILFGDSATVTSFGQSLPVDLSPSGAPGCSLDLNPFFVAPAAGGVTLAIPANPTLAGVTFFWQGMVFDPVLNPLGISTTGLLTITL